MGLSYEKAKKKVFTGFFILLGITLLEVFISLLGKGYVIEGMEKYTWMLYVAGVAMIILSIYKARYIIMEFMHMAYEVQGLRFSVLLPTALLIWAIIAFFQEGNSWKQRRDLIQEKNKVELEESTQTLGWYSEEATDLWG